MCLDNALGLSQKGDPQVTLPTSMQDLITNATSQHQPLTALEIRSLESLFKFGLAAIKIDIQNDVSTSSLPKFKVISGNKICDFKTYKDQNGQEKFKFILIDQTKRLFYQPTKIYIIKRRYKVCGIDQNGEYYEALIQNAKWNGFSLDKPWTSDCIELVYPQFYNRLTFVPIVVFNPQTVRFNEGYNYQFTSAIQTLIDLSLNIYQQDANLKSCYDMLACPTLFVTGSNAKPSDFTLGRYSVNILKDPAAKAAYANPSFTGIDALKDTLDTMKTQANAMLWNILNAAGNASGDSLAIRLQYSTLSLISIVKNIGDAITNALQQMAAILGENADECKFIPYTAFAKMEQTSGNEMKNEILE